MSTLTVERDVVELLTVTISDEYFAIDVGAIREIRRWSSVTPLPGAAASVLGVMNLRGAVVPAVSLATVLGLKTKTPDERSVVIVAFDEGRPTGFLVDEVADIITVPTSGIQKTVVAGTVKVDSIISGIVEYKSHMLKVLNISKAVASNDA